MSNLFMLPETDSILRLRNEAKEETWPKHLCVSPHSLGKPRKCLTETSFPPHFYENIHGQEGRREKNRQAVGFLTRTASLAIGPEGPLSCITCWLPLFLVDGFSGLQRSYWPRDSSSAASISANPEAFMHALFLCWQDSFSGRFLWLCNLLCWYFGNTKSKSWWSFLILPLLQTNNSVF